MINPLYQYLHDIPPASPPPLPPLARLSLKHSFLASSHHEHSLPRSTASTRKTNHTLYAASTPASTPLTTSRDHALSLGNGVLERDRISAAPRPLITTIDYQDHSALIPRCLTQPSQPPLSLCQGLLEGKLGDIPHAPQAQGPSFSGSHSQTESIVPLREQWRESLPPTATPSRPSWRSLPRVPSLQAQVASLPAGYAGHSLFHAPFQRPIALPPPPSSLNYDNENLFPRTFRHHVGCEGKAGWGWREDAPTSPPMPASSRTSFPDLPASPPSFLSGGVMKRGRGDQRSTGVRECSRSIPWSDEGEEDAYWTPSEGSEGSLHEARWSDCSDGSFHTPRWRAGSEGPGHGSRLSEGFVQESRWSVGSFHEFRWSEGSEGASQPASWSDSGIDGDVEEIEKRHREREEETLGGGEETENGESSVAYHWLTSFWGLEVASSGGESLVVAAGRCLGRYLRKQRPASPHTCPASSFFPQVRTN